MSKRIRNFRSGDVAEKKGLAAMSEFCLVAPVPREDDVGIDAVATLLKPSGRFAYASKSFYVQIKSAATREVEYDGERFDWFQELELPLLICSVNKGEGVFELFTTFNARKAIVEGAKSLRLTLDQGSEGVWVGKPVLRWRGTDDGRELQELAFSVLDNLLALDAAERRAAEFDRSLTVRWSTNEPPVATGEVRRNSTQKREVLRRKCGPYFFSLMQTVVFARGEYESVLAGMRFLHQLALLDDYFFPLFKKFYVQIHTSALTGRSPHGAMEMQGGMGTMVTTWGSKGDEMDAEPELMEVLEQLKPLWRELRDRQKGREKEEGQE